MADAITGLMSLLPNLVKLGTEIVTAAGAAKSNTQLIEFQSALISLQSFVASIQQENATLVRQKSDAEEELKSMKAWESEKQKYRMASPFSGAMVYALK